jgi:hypothetical protein
MRPGTRGRPSPTYRLPARLARALERLAPAVLRTRQTLVAWSSVVAQAERWLACMPRHARARIVRVLLLLEWAPLMRLAPPLSRMSRDQVRRYVDGPLSRRRGFWADLGRVRQLLRLAYYADPVVHGALGFVPPAARRASAAPAARSRHVPELVAPCAPSAPASW